VLISPETAVTNVTCFPVIIYILFHTIDNRTLFRLSLNVPDSDKTEQAGVADSGYRLS
jgi:hypothetical protein